MLRDIIGTGLVVVVFLFAALVLVDRLAGIDIIAMGRGMMVDGWSLAGALGF